MTSKLAAMQARFQQKQIQEREEKLLRLYEHQQQKAFERVGRGSAGSNTSLGSSGGGGGGGKVRQMFDERRQKAGVDRSYPLEPLKGTPKSNGQVRGGSMDRLKNNSTNGNRTVIKSTVQKSVSQIKNGKPVISKREVVRSMYNNNDGDETYERYHEETNNDNDAFVRSHHRDIVEMMNNHNLNDTSSSLDAEEMPHIGFDEVDESYFTGKLANVGGMLPSENAAARVNNAKKSPGSGENGGLGKTFRKEAKPIIRRTIRPAVPVTERSSQPNLKPASSPISSPIRSISSQTMSTISKNTTQSKPSAKGPLPPRGPPSTKAPSATRPSANQSAARAVARDDLTECKFCKRRFAADRLQVHEQICSKTSKKKRKIYDATKHRVEGTELEPFVRRGGKGGGAASTKSALAASGKSSKSGAPRKDWRRTHEEFINAIRAAKQAQAHVAKGGKLTDLPPPPPSTNPDYVQCPHCGRRFNEAAAERHIPKCASYDFNKPKPGQAPARTAGKPPGKKF